MLEIEGKFYQAKRSRNEEIVAFGMSHIIFNMACGDKCLAGQSVNMPAALAANLLAAIVKLFSTLADAREIFVVVIKDLVEQPPKVKNLPDFNLTPKHLPTPFTARA